MRSWVGCSLQQVYFAGPERRTSCNEDNRKLSAVLAGKRLLACIWPHDLWTLAIGPVNGRHFNSRSKVCSLQFTDRWGFNLKKEKNLFLSMFNACITIMTHIILGLKSHRANMTWVKEKYYKLLWWTCPAQFENSNRRFHEPYPFEAAPTSASSDPKH